MREIDKRSWILNQGWSGEGLEIGNDDFVAAGDIRFQTRLAALEGVLKSSPETPRPHPRKRGWGRSGTGGIACAPLRPSGLRPPPPEAGNDCFVAAGDIRFQTRLAALEGVLGPPAKRSDPTPARGGGVGAEREGFEPSVTFWATFP
jgi:hypothetical protein